MHFAIQAEGIFLKPLEAAKNEPIKFDLEQLHPPALIVFKTALL